MKKILITIIAMAMCAGNAKALDNEPEEGFTFMGLFGMNISKLQNHDYNTKAGATMGARADFMLPKAHGTYLTAGLDWTMKGGKLAHLAEVDGDVYEASSKYVMHYVELPIRAGFRYNVKENIGVYAEVGPYFAIGIGGRHKRTIDGDGPAVREEEDDFTFKTFKGTGNADKHTFQRWDAGIGFRVGAEYNDHYNLMLGCDWGLADIYRNSLRDKYYTKYNTRLPKVHNFNFSLTFGYRF